MICSAERARVTRIPIACVAERARVTRTGTIVDAFFLRSQLVLNMSYFPRTTQIVQIALLLLLPPRHRLPQLPVLTRLAVKSHTTNGGHVYEAAAALDVHRSQVRLADGCSLGKNAMSSKSGFLATICAVPIAPMS
jgi:hypothetical protein